MKEAPHHDHAQRNPQSGQLTHGAGHHVPPQAATPHEQRRPGEETAHHAHQVGDFQRRFWVSLVLTAPILVLAPVVQRLLGIEQALQFTGAGYAQLGLATAAFFYGGWPFLRGLFREAADRRPGMMTLIAIAITVAYSYSAAVVAFRLSGDVLFWELATLIDIMLLGHWIEMRSVLGASRALEELARLMPDEAHRLGLDGSLQDVHLSDIKPGDRLLVKPGEKVPTDGVIDEGRTSVNQAMLTGESKPVEKGVGDEVLGGSVNGESAIAIRVAKTGEETYLRQIIALVRTAQESRSRTQDLADRAALVLTLIALSAGGATLGAWLVVGRGFAFAVERMVTVMVIACPHALGLAIPLVVAVSTALSAGNGLLIRDRSAFERARELGAIVFDKTGTLTEGRFGVTDVVAFQERTESEVLRLAAGLEAQSEHPIAEGIVRAAAERGIPLPPAQGFQAIPGRGGRAVVEGLDVEVASPAYLNERGLAMDDGRVESLAAQGKTVVCVIVDGQLAGALALSDVIRPESRQAIAQLKGMGIRVMMLTGDSNAVAAWVAAELEVDEYFAEVLPEHKVRRISEVKARGLKVAMVGDGINDAAALVEADVGIAIGAGTDVAIESADVVLTRSDPRDVATTIRLARATYAKMVQNLGWATGYNLLALPLAAGVLYGWGILLTPALGAAFMSLSTVIVAINARLLGRFRLPQREKVSSAPVALR